MMPSSCLAEAEDLIFLFQKGWFIKRFVLKSKWSMVLRFQRGIDRLFYKLNLPGCMEIKF